MVNILPYEATNRAEISIGNTKEIILICQKCSIQEEIKLNNIRARESKKSSIALFLGIWFSILIGGLILFKYWDNDLGIGLSVIEVFGMGLAIPFLIVSVIVREERRLVKIFNEYYV